MVIDRTKQEREPVSITLDQHACPRCFGGIPNDIYRGQYPGALSRTDNKTYICSECGELEALEDFSGVGCAPQSAWRVNQ